MSSARVAGLEWAPGRVIVGGGAERAAALAASNPDVVLDVFERSWAAVDRGRDAAKRRGVSARVHVWHIDAAHVMRRLIVAAARAA